MMRTIPRRTLLATAGITLALSACGVVYVNPDDRNPTLESATSFVSHQRAEATYRVIYTRLLDCTSGYYRVEGKFDNISKRGDISVDTGVGFQRSLYFADARVMRIDITPGEGSTSKVTVHEKTKHSSPFVNAMAPWVNEGSQACRA